jgi:hypothetical protein
LGHFFSLIKLANATFLSSIMKCQTSGLYNVTKDLAEKKNLSKSMPEKAAQLAAAMDKYLNKVDAMKIDEVYKARFAELEEFKQKAIEDEKRNLAKKLSRATSGHDKIKADSKKKLDQRLANYDKQIEHCRMQTLNENFIGGNYTKKK